MRLLLLSTSRVAGGVLFRQGAEVRVLEACPLVL